MYGRSVGNNYLPGWRICFYMASGCAQHNRRVIVAESAEIKSAALSAKCISCTVNISRRITGGVLIHNLELCFNGRANRLGLNAGSLCVVHPCKTVMADRTHNCVNILATPSFGVAASSWPPASYSSVTGTL